MQFKHLSISNQDFQRKSFLESVVGCREYNKIFGQENGLDILKDSNRPTWLAFRCVGCIQPRKSVSNEVGNNP